MQTPIVDIDLVYVLLEATLGALRDAGLEDSDILAVSADADGDAMEGEEVCLVVTAHMGSSGDYLLCGGNGETAKTPC